MIITNWVDAEKLARKEVERLRLEIRELSDIQSGLKSSIFEGIQSRQELDVQINNYEKSKYAIETEMSILRDSMKKIVNESVDNASKSLAIRDSIESNSNSLKLQLQSSKAELAKIIALKEIHKGKIDSLEKELSLKQSELTKAIMEKESIVNLIEQLDAKQIQIDKKEANMHAIYSEMKNARKALEEKEQSLIEKENKIKKLLGLEQ